MGEKKENIKVPFADFVKVEMKGTAIVTRNNKKGNELTGVDIKEEK